MTPENQQNIRTMRKRMTKRQAQRRSNKYSEALIGTEVEPTLSTNKELEQIYTFGRDSRVYRGGGRYVFDMHEKDLQKFDALQLANVVNYARNPMVDVMKKMGEATYPIRPAKIDMLHIGVWMNNVQHYSGGRIHILLACHLLAEMGHKVTVVTDCMPPMLPDFKYFEVEDRLEFVAEDVCHQSQWLLKNEQNNMDLVMVTPRIMEGFAYAHKWNLPCYGMLLESPNFVSEYRGGLDGTEAYWQDYKAGLLKYANGIFSNPGPTLDKVKEWLDAADYQGDYFAFPPAINTPACDRVDADEKNEVTFIGRHLDFKCPDDVIKSVGKIKREIRPSINFVGSHNGTVRSRMQLCADQHKVEIRFYARINDFEKFAVIKRSKVIVIPSRFEGFGMPPAEALYCNKPVVVYDLPITKWIYGDALTYVKPGDLKGMASRIAKFCTDEKLRAEHGEYGHQRMWDEDSNIPCLPHKIKGQIRNILYGEDYPKITAGVIVLNGVDTLKPTLESIYPSVEKIIVVEGAVEDYAVNNPKLIKGGHSIDGTLQFLEDYPDPLNKIEIVKVEDCFPDRKNRCWKNKNEMQNAIAERIETEIYLKVDSDEVWKESDIEYVRRVFMKKKDLTVIYMQRWHFWKNLETVATGGQWDSAEARAWRWNPSFRHNVDVPGGFNYYFDDNGVKVAAPEYKAYRMMMRMHYHLGYCRDDEHIRGKINYYANRGIERNVKDQYSNWQPGQPTNSTHPNGTTAVPFVGRLPIVLDELNYPKHVKASPLTVTENNVSMLKSPNK